MATHFDCIGFRVDSLNDFNTLVGMTAPLSKPVTAFARGTYLQFATPEGCEFWMQMSPDGEIIGGHPHFAGTGGPAAAGFALDLGQTTAGAGSALDGGLHGTMAEEEGCGCPVVFEVPDFQQHAAHLTLPVRARVQLVGFAEELSISASDEEFWAAQRAESEARTGDKSGRTMAPESFIPSGLFNLGGAAGAVPQARAVLAGHILAWQRRKNVLRDRPFYVLTIRTLGGCMDIVASDQMVLREPQVGGVVFGTFWLSGRILEPLSPPPEPAQTEPTPDQPEYWKEAGGLMNGTFARRAAKVPLNFLRYCRYSAGPRFGAQCFLWFAGLAALLFLFHWWVLGTLFVLPALIFAALLIRLRMLATRIFKNAALTPGVVISTYPLEFVSLADMNTGLGSTVIAVKREVLRALPGYSTAFGTRFPCVSSFLEGSSEKRWENFFPIPLSLGTGNLRLVEARASLVGAEEYAELDRLIADGRIPAKAREIFFIDEPPAASPPRRSG